MVDQFAPNGRPGQMAVFDACGLPEWWTPEIKLGDVVCLNGSDEPRMTVVHLAHRGAEVRYVAGGELRTDVLPKEALRLARQEPPQQG
jgi:hypothetical protein